MRSFAAAADLDGSIGSAASASRTAASTTALAGVSVLLVAAPFERLEPLLVLPGQSLSSAEVVLAAAGLAWLTAVARSCTRPDWRTPLTWPWLALVAAMVVSAAVAPSHRVNAFNMAGRFALAFGVYFLTVNAVTSVARLRALLLVATVAGAVVAAVVVLEYFDVGTVMERLAAFRERPAIVGTQLRAGGPFQYATIASMFLEIVFALSLAWILVAVDARASWRLASAVAVLALLAWAIVLTYTRAGLGTMAASLSIVAWVRWRRHGVDRAVQALGLVAAIVVALLAGTRSVESLRLRLTTEGMDAWFMARIEGPRHLQLTTGETIRVPVVVANIGRSTWDSASPQPFLLSYHWLRADEDLVVDWNGERTMFPAPVRPGDRVALHARVRAPSRPGDYRLLWDVEHEHRLWFSTEPGAPRSMATATVTGPPIDRGDTREMALPLDASRPGRLALWDAARRMFAERPITGIGPDNFRLTYGPYLNRPRFDTRVHTNSMYLEVLVGGGLLAFVAFAWLFWRSAGRVHAALRRDGDAQPMPVAIAAAVAAIALHGLVDTFWGFTATYVLMAVTLGLATRAAAPLGACPANERHAPSRLASPADVGVCAARAARRAY